MVLEKLSNIVAEQLGMDNGAIKAETLLKEDLKADSLDIVEIIMAIEEEFDIQVDDEDALKFKTIGDVAAYIESLLK